MIASRSAASSSVLSSALARASRSCPTSTASDRGDSDHLLRRRRQLFEPGQQDVDEWGREQGVVSGCAAGVQELLGVVGVAFGPVEDPPHGHVVDRRAVQGRQISAHLLGVEGTDVETLDNRQPAELGDQWAKRVRRCRSSVR